MTTSNNINTGGIDPLYPVAGSDNDSQGFRDNFKQIQDALNASKTAIATLEGTSPSTQGSNDFNDNLITKAIFRDTAMSAPSAETLAGETNVDLLLQQKKLTPTLSLLLTGHLQNQWVICF